MKLQMTWDAGKSTKSCRLKSSLPQSDTRAVMEHDTPHANCHVLVVDDDANLARLMATILRTSGIQTLTATDCRTALATVEDNQVDAIVLDVQMPLMNGCDFYRELRSRGIETPVLIASAYGAREYQRELGAQASVEKPFDPELLVSELERILPDS